MDGAQTRVSACRSLAMQRRDALPLLQAQDALAARGHNDGLCERGVSCGRTPHAAPYTQEVCA